MNPELVSPVVLQQYLRARAWQLAGQSTHFAVYVQGEVELEVQLSEHLADYPRRLREALEPLAHFENRTTRGLLDELLDPPGGCGFSPNSPQKALYRWRTRFKSGRARGIYCSPPPTASILPRPFYPRLSRTQPARLVASIHEALGQRGSMVSRFVVPVERLDAGEDPYGRRVLRLLFRALDKVHQVRSLGDGAPLLRA